MGESSKLNKDNSLNKVDIHYLLHSSYCHEEPSQDVLSILHIDIYLKTYLYITWYLKQITY